MFVRLGALVLRARVPIAVTRLLAAVAAFLAGPSLSSVTSSGTAGFLPPDSPSRHGRGTAHRAVPVTRRMPPSATVVLFRDGGLTDADRALAAAIADATAQPGRAGRAAGRAVRRERRGRPGARRPLPQPGRCRRAARPCASRGRVRAGRRTPPSTPSARSSGRSCTRPGRCAGGLGHRDGGHRPRLPGRDRGRHGPHHRRDRDPGGGHPAAHLPGADRGAGAAAHDRCGVRRLARRSWACWPRRGWQIPSLLDAFVVVLVFGVGTDYAIFLLSRQREELAPALPASAPRS